MGYSEDGYAGDVDAAAAAAAGAAAGGVLAAAAAAAASSAQPGDASRAAGNTNTSSSGTTWSSASSSTSSFEPPDSGSSSFNSYDSGDGSRKPLFGGLIGWIGRVWASILGQDSGIVEPAGSPAEILSGRALEAYAIHKSFCDQSTAYVADAFGHAELNDKSANQQVAYIETHWTRLDSEGAQDLANRGGLVVAGLAQLNGIGHTAIVTPGQGWRDADGNFYPNVTNGGSPAVQSDGSRTVADVWSARDRANVGYYTP